MEFDAPQRLLALLAIPLLYLLTLRPSPKREVATPHWSVWQRALRVQSRPPRPRLRFLLLALSFCAVTFAASGAGLGRRDGPFRLVIVVDRSASTGLITAEGTTVLERLREALRSELDQWPGSTPSRFAFCAEGVEVFEGSLQDATRASAWTPLQETCSVDVAALTVPAQADRQVAVVVVGDTQTRFPGTTAEIRWNGGPARRRGIVSADCRDDWPLATARVRIVVSDDRPDAEGDELRLEIAGAPRQIGAEVRPTDSAGERALELDFERSRGGLLRVALGGDDGFTDDDFVEFVLPAPPRGRVVTLGDSDAIAMAAGFVRELFGRDGEPEAERDPAAIVLADGGRVAAFAPGMISFGVRTSAELPVIEDSDTFLVDWDRRHPLLDGLDLSEMRVRRYLPRDFAPAGSEVLLRGRDGPLLVAWNDGGRRSVHAAFRLEDSNLWRLPAFPRLIQRCVRWLMLGEASALHPEPRGLLRRDETEGFPPGDAASTAGAGGSAGVELRGFPLRPGDPGRSLGVPLVVLAILLLGVRSLWP